MVVVEEEVSVEFELVLELVEVELNVLVDVEFELVLELVEPVIVTVTVELVFEVEV